MNRFTGGLAVTLALALALPSEAQDNPAPTAEQAAAADQAYARQMQAILENLHPQKGDIAIAAAKATLHLGDGYYFLNAEESRKVIVDAWGNPPEQADDVLGMVFPSGKTFLDEDSWGAVVTYEETGFVKDDDAASTDYNALMKEMQSGESEINEARAKEGFPAIHLVGWAERPRYNARLHSVIWARNLQFAGSALNSLNYDVRLLGRYGVLSLNMVSTMPRLDEIKSAASRFGAAATFDQGARYADFDPSSDDVAEYGIGGLVAAGVGLAAAKKLGFLALLLAFGKKFFVLIIAGLAISWKFIKSRIARKEDGAY